MASIIMTTNRSAFVLQALEVMAAVRKQQNPMRGWLDSKRFGHETVCELGRVFPFVLTLDLCNARCLEALLPPQPATAMF